MWASQKDREYASTAKPMVFWAVICFALMLAGLVFLAAAVPNTFLPAAIFASGLAGFRIVTKFRIALALAGLVTTAVFVGAPVAQNMVVARQLQKFERPTIVPSEPIRWHGHVLIEAQLLPTRDGRVRSLHFATKLLLEYDVTHVTIRDGDWVSFAHLASGSATVDAAERTVSISNSEDCRIALSEFRLLLSLQSNTYDDKNYVRRQQLTPLLERECIEDALTPEPIDFRLRFGRFLQGELNSRKRVFGFSHHGPPYREARPGARICFVDVSNKNGDIILRHFIPRKSAWIVPLTIDSLDPFKGQITIAHTEYPDPSDFYLEQESGVGDRIAELAFNKVLCGNNYVVQ